VRLRFQTLLLGFGLAIHAAAETLPEARVVQSQSGQFSVSKSPVGTRTPAASALATNAQFIELEPGLLVVTCERVRQALWRDLGLTEQWRGRIHLRLRTARSADDPIAVTLEQFRDHWDYRVELPDLIERARLMRALVEVLLLEAANQQSAGRSAELPPWLAVGLAERLLSASEVLLLFPTPQVHVRTLSLGPLVVASREVDSLATARVRLREHPPLTLQELTWPTDRDFSGDSSAAYRASAQLFVSDLLRLPDSDACFRNLLKALPQFFNWQTAFLQAFHTHFERLLDLEKWWSLQSVAFATRDPARTWPVTESLVKLAETLQVPAEVRDAANQLPSSATSVSLQTAINGWDSPRQTPVLRDRLQQLDALRQHLAPELLPLLGDYHRVIASYLDQRDKLGVSLARGRLGRPALKRLMADTVRQLDQLDARAKDFHPATPPDTALPTNAAPRALSR
jgi:hypothetical protein